MKDRDNTKPLQTLFDKLYLSDASNTPCELTAEEARIVLRVLGLPRPTNTAPVKRG